MNDSILTSIKKMLGITSEYTHFDADLVICINTVISILTQLGVGPKSGFSIHDDTTTWGGFLGTDERLEMVKNYIHLRVKIMFDPPQNASLAKVFEDDAKELEWRIMIAAEQAPEDLADLPEPGTITNTFAMPFCNEPIPRSTLKFGEISKR